MGEEGDDPTVPRAVIHRKILDVAESRPDASLQAIADEVSGASLDLVDRVLAEYGDPHGDGSSDLAASDADGTAPNGAEEPGSNPDDESSPDADSPPSSGESLPAEREDATGNADATPPELTAKQRRTLRVVAENPGASQSAVAQQLDVTAATVSRRLNAIPGFDWQRRAAFARRLFGSDDTASGHSGLSVESPPAASADDTGAAAEPADSTPASAADRAPDETSTSGDDAPGQPATERSPNQPATERLPGEVARGAVRLDGDAEAAQPSVLGDEESLSTALDRLHRSISDLERQLETADCPDASGRLDPELVHKVVHACIESDDISSDEEVVVLRRLLGAE
jgi:hypothetical protein